MKTFYIAEFDGGSEVNILAEFEYLGRKYILHNPNYLGFNDKSTYIISDYLTGRRFHKSWTNKKTAIIEAKNILEKNKGMLDKMFKKYKTINP